MMGSVLIGYQMIYWEPILNFCIVIVGPPNDISDENINYINRYLEQ